MFILTKKIIKTYFSQFWFYIKIILPMLLPLLTLRLIGHYLYLGGRLTLIFSTLFGLILLVLGVIIEIILIQVSWQIIKQTQSATNLKQQWKKAMSVFWSYLGLKILLAIITCSVPFILSWIKPGIENEFLKLIINLVIITWLAGFSILFIFSNYILITEKSGIIKALDKGTDLLVQKPLETIIKFIINILIIAIIIIFISIITNVIIAIINRQMYILTNPYLSPWWQKLVIDVYAVLSLPLLIILSTIMFADLKKNIKSKEQPAQKEI